MSLVVLSEHVVLYILHVLSSEKRLFHWIVFCLIAFVLFSGSIASHLGVQLRADFLAVWWQKPEIVFQKRFCILFELHIVRLFW